MNATTNETDTEVWVYDEIGFWGVTAQDFARELQDVDSDTITLRLNSPGGEVYDGIAIMNALIDHKARVIVKVDALAASIASVIAMAGDEVVMGAHSEFMIHDASTIAIGNAAEVREVADQLDRVSENIASVYAERSGGKAEDWRKLMLAETWFSADEAVAAGLADRVAPKPKQREGSDEGDVEDRARTRARLLSRWDLSNFKHAGRSAAPAPQLSVLTAGGGASKRVIPDVEEFSVEDTDDAACEHGTAMTEACTEGDCERDAVVPDAPEQLADEVDDLDDIDFSGLFSTSIGAALVEVDAETDGIDTSVFHAAVRMVTDAPVPAPSPAAAALAAPLSPVFPADAVAVVVDLDTVGIDPEIFRAAVDLAANSAPATIVRSNTNPDPDDSFVIDPAEFYNSLREAMTT